MTTRIIQIDGYYDLPEPDAANVRREALRDAHAMADRHCCVVEIYDGDTVVEVVLPTAE